MNKKNEFQLSCPTPLPAEEQILLGHGGGGKLTQKLLKSVFYPAFESPALNEAHDGAVLPWNAKKIAMTTDSFVVHPRFFAGGDIGKLAICGTANDLAMCGAKPLYLSASFILEEGFTIRELKQIVQSMRETAQEAGLQIVTGDTKVVERGHGDGIFITTTGVGALQSEQSIRPQSIQPGDVVILSGDIGRHGMAILSQRENLGFEGEIISDCGLLWPAVEALLKEKVELHCLRDLTRGGLSGALIELAETAQVEIVIQEEQIDVNDTVRGAAEILGLDSLYLANEGTMVIFVPQKDLDRTLTILKSIAITKNAKPIGTVSSMGKAQVLAENSLGTTRVLDHFSGEQLPRIC